MVAIALDRTKENPWVLKTAPGTSSYTVFCDEREGMKVLVCTVGGTVLLYDARCIEDLRAMLQGRQRLGGAGRR